MRKSLLLVVKKKDTLLRACRDNADDTGAYIIDNQEKIQKGEITIRYHPSCRSSYAKCTEKNLQTSHQSLLLFHVLSLEIPLPVQSQITDFLTGKADVLSVV